MHWEERKNVMVHGSYTNTPPPFPRVFMTHERGVGDPIWAGEVVIPHVYYQGLGIFWVGKSLSHALPYC
jgi:hypothetical protein